jgi:site-specific recombinase XerD
MSNQTTPLGYTIPAVRKVSPLRQRMIEDMRVRNFALNTQESYLRQVSLFARHFGRSPDQLGPEEIRAYQVYLTDERQVSVGTRIVAVSALRFFYAVTLQRDWTPQLIPCAKKDHRLPIILSPAEVLQLLQAAPSFTHHVIFSTMYGTGMRVTEAVHLRAADLDSQRMMIRIELSKGHKGRDVQLSPKLLELLRCYWRRVRPKEWMFPGQIPNQPLCRFAVGDAVAQAGKRAGLKKHVTPHSLRHAYAVHLLESGTDVRRIQLLLGHRSLATTARYLRLATTTVCATTSPLDLLPLPIADPQA